MLAFSELRDRMHVVALPLTTRFRGVTEREAVLVDGPKGWTEFSPFLEYGDEESSAWLAAAIEFGWTEPPSLSRDRIRVNATMPAVAPERVAEVLARFPGCRTVKVKVAEAGQTLDEDVARVAEVRRLIGPEGRLRVDANGAWGIDAAERALHALSAFDLEYAEQPCASIEELAELRTRLRDWDVPIAADESVRKADDPLAVAAAGAADLLVLKVQPLGGIAAALRILSAASLPVVVSSALDTSVGLSMGAHLAAAVPHLDFDCGLGTAALLAADVTTAPLHPVDGEIPVMRVDVDRELLTKYRPPADRVAWWEERVDRCLAVLAATAPNRRANP